MRLSKEMLVGIVFVIAVCIALFGTIAIGGFEFFTPRAKWVVDLSDLSGLQVGDDVQVLGSRMGSVRKIEWIPARHVFEVTLRMQADAPIFTGYRIVVRESSALGGRYLSVQPGPLTNQRADTEHLVAEPGAGDAMGELSRVLQKLGTIIEDIRDGKGTVGKLLTQDDIYRDLRDTTASLRAITGRIERGEGTIGKFVTRDEVYDQIRDVVTKLNVGKGALPRLIQDESGSIIQDLQAAAANVRSATAKIDGGDGTLGRLVNDPKLYDSAASAFGTADKMMQDVRDSKGVVGMLISDEKVRDNAARGIEDVRVVLDQARNGDGTLGKLITNPELYDNFNSVGKNLNASAEKISSGQGTIGKLINDDDFYQKVKRLLTRAIDTIENGRDSAPVAALTSFLFGPFQ